MIIWTVTETPCYPNSFKVHPKGYFGDNSPNNFFSDLRLAWLEADRRTERDSKAGLMEALGNNHLE